MVDPGGSAIVHQEAFQTSTLYVAVMPPVYATYLLQEVAPAQLPPAGVEAFFGDYGRRGGVIGVALVGGDTWMSV